MNLRPKGYLCCWGVRPKYSQSPNKRFSNVYSNETVNNYRFFLSIISRYSFPRRRYVRIYREERMRNVYIYTTRILWGKTPTNLPPAWLNTYVYTDIFFLTLSLWDELSSSLPGTSNDQTMTFPTKSSTQLLRRGRGSISPWMGAVRGSTYSLSGYEMSKDVSRTRQKDSKCQPATWGHLAGIKDDFKNSQTIPDYLGMIVGDRTWFDRFGKAVKKKHRLGKVVKKKIRFFQYH